MIYIYYINIHNIKPCDFLEHGSLSYLISTERLNKINKFQKKIDKLQSLCSELLILFALEKFGQTHTDKLVYNYNPFGKPELLNYDFSFNISHSKDYVICAIANHEYQKSIGIDIEFKDVNTLLTINPKIFLTEVEYLSLTQSDNISTYCDRLLDYWCMKEAYVKYLGKGLTQPLKDFYIVSKDNNNNIFHNESIVNCNMMSLEIDDKYSSYLCYESKQKIFLQEVTCYELFSILNR